MRSVLGLRLTQCSLNDYQRYGSLHKRAVYIVAGWRQASNTSSALSLALSASQPLTRCPPAMSRLCYRLIGFSQPPIKHTSVCLPTVLQSWTVLSSEALAGDEMGSSPSLLLCQNTYCRLSAVKQQASCTALRVCSKHQCRDQRHATSVTPRSQTRHHAICT